MISCYGNLSRLRQYADSKIFKGDYREDSERHLFLFLIGIKIILVARYWMLEAGALGQPRRIPCRPWRGTLASGHKPR